MIIPGIEEVTPRCDICNWPENHEGESDWNGETGNHVSCECMERENENELYWATWRI